MEYFRSDLTEEPSLVITKELLVAARIPRGLWNCSLSKIPSTLRHFKALDVFVKGLPLLEKKGKCLYLYGPYGRGKSGAAVAVAKEAMCRGGRVIFFSAHELDSIFGKNPDYDLKNAVLKTHFLVFDDVGAEKAIPWAAPWIEAIIKLRNNDLLPTFITSNDTPDNLMERIKSVASMLGTYEDIYVDGHDWRLNGPPKIILAPQITEEPSRKIPTDEIFKIAKEAKYDSIGLCADPELTEALDSIKEKVEEVGIKPQAKIEIVQIPVDKGDETHQTEQEQVTPIKLESPTVIPVNPELKQELTNAQDNLTNSIDGIADSITGLAKDAVTSKVEGNQAQPVVIPESTEVVEQVKPFIARTGKKKEDLGKESEIHQGTINRWFDNDRVSLNNTEARRKWIAYCKSIPDKTPGVK